jgi:hypothetical protein
MRGELLHLARIKPNARVLVLSCGYLRELDGVVLGRFSPTINVVGVEADAAYAQLARRRLVDPRIGVITGSADQLRNTVLEPASFDFVYSLAPRPGPLWADLGESLSGTLSFIKPGGALVLLFAASGRSDAAYGEAFLDLWFSEAGESHLVNFFQSLGPALSLRTLREPHGSFIVCRLSRHSSQRRHGGAIKG